MKGPTAAMLMALAFAALGSPAKPGPWQALFDGKTTAGWRGYNNQAMPDGWTVVDGALTRGGTSGDIVSLREFGDFELEAEWKIAPKANSGLFYRVVEHPDDTEMWMAAPEYQPIAFRSIRVRELE